MNWTALLRRPALIVGLCLILPTLSVGKSEDDDSKKAQSAKWDVGNPPGPRSEVVINTKSGTWMSVDVHPHKEELIFDLLGDIYTISLSGGAAKALSSGMAWDMQPRYSPDGQWIAFTSDRGGGDNLWIMPSSGGEPRSVTKEKFRLLNSPEWSPDGRFLVARKHYTSRRSLGAGELWLYHVAGGTGRQLTKKSNDQKDLGEPAFSADGKHLFFSQDITPGTRFEYNKDPNGAIYGIKRLNLEDGVIESWIANSGGAIRPSPSPDGKQLAFIRRVRGKTCLFVQDLQSGLETLIYDELDRDMQETWAVHGVYPGLSWTPDSRAVVFWARGGIFKIQISTRALSQINFHVRDTRMVSEALQFTFDPAPESFQTRMNRWPHIAPNERSVIFQALGHIYTRPLKEKSKPARRLTTQNQHFEHYPSFSPDGRWVAYTTWDDQELGSLRIRSYVGTEERTLNAQPGHFLEPAFSHDSKMLVYRKAGGGYIRSPLWSTNKGIYLYDLEANSTQRISRSGRGAHFNHDSTRVFFLDHGKKNARILKSVDLDGGAPRQHATSQRATDFRVSPDGKWLLFREGFHAYLTPMSEGGEKLKIGPDMKAFPVVKLSSSAAWNPRWNARSDGMHWTSGTELISIKLDSILSKKPGQPRESSLSSKIPAESFGIGVEVALAKPSGMLALRGATLVTMKGDEVIPNGVIIIDRNRIIEVGPEGSVKIPARAKLIDLSGTTIFPGIIDVHAHGGQATQGIVPEQNWESFASLAFGVTSIHDPSNDTQSIFAAKEMALAGKIVGPRIFSTGTILYGAEGHFRAIVDNKEDARDHLARMKAVGANSVKSYNQPRRDQRQQIIASARELKLHVMPEGGSLFQHNMTMLVDGHTGIEHALPVAAAYEDVLQLWGGTKVGYTPTLVVAYGGLFGELYWYQESPVWKHPRLQSFVPRERLDPVARRNLQIPEIEWNHPNAAALTKGLHDSGVRVHLGGHGQREGLAAHWELWMLAEGGFRNLDAWRAATISGAQYLGIDQSLGSIEVGKLADLIVVEGQPLENIRDSERIRYTIVNGRLYDAATMNELGNSPRTRAPFFWERPRSD